MLDLDYQRACMMKRQGLVLDAAAVAAIVREDERTKAAIKAEQRAYREANRDKIKAGQRAYYEANRDKIKAEKRAYMRTRRALLKATLVGVGAMI